MPDLNGQWLGKLIYGRSFGKLENEALIFTVEIKPGKDGFSGVSKDIDGIGIHPQQATVYGFTDNNIINFIKQYIGTPELNSRNKLVNTAAVKGPELSFTGSWDQTSNEFSGEWVILESYTACSNVFYENAGGWWSMKRA